MMRGMGGGSGDGRLSLEIRGHDLDDVEADRAGPRRRCSTPRPASPTRALGRDEGRPELAVRVDRAKAALLGLTVTGVANTIRTNVAGTQAAHVPRARQRVPDHRPAARGGPRGASPTSATCWSARRSGQVLPAKNLMVVDRDTGPGADRAQEPGAHRSASTPRPRSTLSEAVDGRPGAAARDQRAARTSRSASAPKSRSRRKSFNELQLVLILAIVLVYAVMASQYESLRDPFIIMFSVPLAAIGVVLAAQAHRHVVQPAGLHRRHHAGRHRRQQRHPAGGLHQHAAPPRQDAAARGGRAGRPARGCGRF